MTRRFVALTMGDVVLRAHRSVCGEVLQCRPHQREFSVTIVVALTTG